MRPWLYRQPSLPAFTNERVNLEIRPKRDAGRHKSWLVSIVGCTGGSTIEIDPKVRVGPEVEVGQEIALFRLGSTCCIVAPVQIDSQVG